MDKKLAGKAMDWRGQLRKNERATRWVIAGFFLIYLCIGLLLDAFIWQSDESSKQLLNAFLPALLHGTYVPIATIIMFVLAFFSVLIAFAFHNRIMLLGTEYHEVNSDSTDAIETQLFNVIEEMKIAAGLTYMPKIFIIEAAYMNAFASGYSEKSAMVAITRGLMERLDRQELQAVMAHELSHIRHHDIKLTLMVSVLSNIYLMVLDFLFYSIVYAPKNNDKKSDNRLFIIVFVLRYTLPLLTAALTLFLSRSREYMADAGAVELMRDNEPLARALIKITEDHEAHTEEYAQEYAKTAHEQVRQAAYIYDAASVASQFSPAAMFSTHPSLEERLKALGFERKD